MGWTWYNATHYKKGKIDRKAECDKQFTYEGSPYEVLKSSMVGSTYYGAIKKGDMVIGVVFLTKTNTKDYYNFGYKDMDETCGPYQFDCPKTILDLLTPTDNECANEWRRKCNEKRESKKTAFGLNKLPVGTKIKFTLTFNTARNKKGDEIILTKMQRTARTTYWVQGWCYWTRPLMKHVERDCTIEILEG